MEKRLRRSVTDKRICGVCGGIGEYLGIDPNLIRLGWAAISLFAGSGVILYIIAAVILPEGEREEKDLNDILHPEQEDRE